AIGGMMFFSSFRKEPESRTPPPRARLVQTIVVNLDEVVPNLEAFGRLRSAQPVVLTSEVAGILQAGKVPFQPGQSFRRGDLLLRIDDRQARNDLNSAKSDLLTAMAQVLPEIKVDFPAEFPTWEKYFNSITFDKSLPELPAAGNQKIKLFLARFNVYRLYYAVRNQEVRLQKHAFYAPFDGAIVSTNLRVGASAGSNTRLGEIINMEELEVEVPIEARELSWVDRNREVHFSANEVTGSWTGKVKRVGSALDPQTQTLSLFLSVKNGAQSGLYEGVFLKSRIPGKPVQKGFRVPNRAIYEDRFVYRIKNGRLDYREVGIAVREAESVVIDEGLAEGDTLVVEPMQGVAPGMLAKSQSLQISGRKN
ncbi:MAG: efflux RND transporter periplasmic adaptor subunit, partial [Calditrichaeota bacterium]|nr:efflux RND transporter periplasmic adaptor subunit [Calditrichota bacterium]